ncbi:SLAM family member 9-like isoform X2 [Rhineura floridana]|uniref:SLAM family member 9-like isoform X2 n=1 Tax=Rhineura floridana TaxID=261503 RepID=UPI002AC8488F|nr:SLAM family member 9-like isoform X2 [Rhineura floridana]
MSLSLLSTTAAAPSSEKTCGDSQRSLRTTSKKVVVNCIQSGLETFLLLLSFLSGTASNPVQNSPQYQVNGILGGSIVLAANISSAETVDTSEWDFTSKPGVRLSFAEFRDGKLERRNPRDRFGQRLEMARGTTLRIKDLEMEDSGVYSVRMRFVSNQIEDHTFHLTLYEPVPEPQILPRNVSNSTKRCNVTLQCQVSGKGEFDISWKRGNSPRDTEDGSDWYQLSDNGRDLCLSWWPTSSEPTFTCLVTNPADQKSVSFNMLSICQMEEGGKGRIHWQMVLGIMLILGAAVVTGIWLLIWKKRRKRAASTVPREEESPPELQYSEITKRSPPEGDEVQEHHHLSDLNPTRATEVYAMLQMPTSGRVT